MKAFVLALAGFFLLGAAWAVSLPVNGTYDEKHHIVRAYAVVHGQWLPTHTASDEEAALSTEAYEVPATLLPANPHCAWIESAPASCQEPMGESGSVVEASGAARYNPLYYLPVGLPLLISPDSGGIVAARLISALLSALLLAAAVAIAVRWGSRLQVAAVALAATPIVVNLAGSVNPNGLEISAGVLLFSALLAALTQPERPRWLLACVAVAAVLLITVRHLGPVLFAIDVAAVAVVVGVRAALRDTAVRKVLAIAAGSAVAAAVLWTLVARATDLDITRGTVDPGWGELLTTRLRFYVQQIVGQFGYGETVMSPLAVALWYALIGVLVVPALLRGGRRVVLACAGLVAVSFALLYGLELYFLDLTGRWFAHGRYVLPVLVGVVIIAGRVEVPRPAWFAPALVIATVAVHAYALARVVSRYAHGPDSGFDPFGGQWSPPVNPAIAVTAVATGVFLLSLTAQSDQIGTVSPVSTRTVSTH